MYASLKFAFVINHTIKTEEHVYCNKEECQDQKTKPNKFIRVKVGHITFYPVDKRKQNGQSTVTSSSE